MTMNGAAHEKAPRAVLNGRSTLVDTCIANGLTHENVFHTLSGSVGNYLSLG
jgi:hypothetical protein